MLNNFEKFIFPSIGKRQKRKKIKEKNSEEKKSKK